MTSHSFRVREPQSPRLCFASHLAKNKKRYVSATAETALGPQTPQELRMGGDLQRHTEPCFSSEAVNAHISSEKTSVYLLKVLHVPSLPTWKNAYSIVCRS